MYWTSFIAFVLAMGMTCLMILWLWRRAARAADERTKKLTEYQARSVLVQRRQVENLRLTVEEARQRAEPIMTDLRHFASVPAPTNPDEATANLLDQLAPELRSVLSRFERLEPNGNRVVIGARPVPARIGLSFLKPIGKDVFDARQKGTDVRTWWRLSEHQDAGGLPGYWLKIGEHNGVGEYVALPEKESIYRVDAWLSPPDLPEPESPDYPSIYHWLLDFASLTD